MTLTVEQLIEEAQRLIVDQYDRKALLLRRIDARQSSRNWSALPNSFESDACKHLYGEIKSFFDKRDIRPRIQASRARTFTDLRYAINLMNYL